MDKEKEELTEAVMGAMEYREKTGTPNFERIAGNLINAGYGNVKQTIKEFVKKLEPFEVVIEHANQSSDSYVKVSDIDELIKELYGED